MSLLVDLFGYLDIILHGLTIVAQSMALGGVLFLLLVAAPFEAGLARGGDIRRRVAGFALVASLALAALELLAIGLKAAVLIDTVDLGLGDVLGARFAEAGLVKAAAALAMAALLVRPWRMAWHPARSVGAASVAVADRRTVVGASVSPAIAGLLLLAGGVELGAATLGTHAAARLENSALLLPIEALHQFGAAIWIGGIASFLIVLARLERAADFRRVAARFSRMSMAGVAAIVVSGLVMSIEYIGSIAGFYGTAFGVMVGAKIAMFGGLLLLGLGNFLVTERLGRDPDAPVIRMRRFAEVELGVGFTIFFAAASLTSVPPAIDLKQDRVTLSEIATRNAPAWPRLSSPDHDTLAIPELQSKLDSQAATMHRPAVSANEPGSGELPPRNAADIAWSEYNHHWAGLFVLAIGLLALLERGGIRAARNWPLLFIGLAIFLLLRSDPEVWPLGSEDFMAAWRDVEVAQHRMFVSVVVAFGVFEWLVRTGRLRSARAALVFPLMVSLGGALLLTHTHQIANVKDQLLIELTHTPLALASVAAGWARWLELRLPGRGGRIAGTVWPACFLLIGVILLWYREA